jgi:hypothetical protein
MIETLSINLLLAAFVVMAIFGVIRFIWPDKER